MQTQFYFILRRESQDANRHMPLYLILKIKRMISLLISNYLSQYHPIIEISKLIDMYLFGKIISYNLNKYTFSLIFSNMKVKAAHLSHGGLLD